VPRAEELASAYGAGRPFRHVVIEPFLDSDLLSALEAQFPRFEQRYARNERGQAGGKAVVPQVAKLGSAYRQFDRLMRDADFLKLIEHITGIPALLYDPDYVGGGTHENLDGQELDPHVDFNYHPRLRWHRRLNLIVFLNREWEESWGGCLELLPDPWARNATIYAPLANRAVIFETTEASWHGFRRIQTPPGRQISRRSIAVYYYTKERPAEETASSHGTLYFQRPLPPRFQAGYTLAASDVAEILALLARRDGHMQFLYERETEFTRLIEGITQSPSFRIGRALTWPGRALRGLLRS
jgi:Rps23 Pro-64 3,4-dihydroxylase Tpa1-like proline 4-hydroxylase